MAGDPGQTTTVEAASKRLEQALALLDERVRRQLAQAGESAGGLLDQDRSQLAAQLDEAKGRQRELEDAGARVSEALGRAIAEIEANLGHRGA